MKVVLILVAKDKIFHWKPLIKKRKEIWSGVVCKFLDVITCHVSIGRDRLLQFQCFFLSNISTHLNGNSWWVCYQSGMRAQNDLLQCHITICFITMSHYLALVLIQHLNILVLFFHNFMLHNMPNRKGPVIDLMRDFFDFDPPKNGIEII